MFGVNIVNLMEALCFLPLLISSIISFLLVEEHAHKVGHRSGDEVKSNKIYSIYRFLKNLTS